MASPSTAHTGAGRDDHDQPRVAALRGRPDRRVHGHPRTTLTSLAGRRHSRPTPDLIRKLTRSRGWLYDTMLELELGVDCGRVTSPSATTLTGWSDSVATSPGHPGEPKMLAAPGSQRALLPHPAAEASEQVPLVEGEPDIIAARSRGLPAVAVPGVDGWRTAWASLFAGCRVVEVMHCDEDGGAAAAITNDIKRVRPAGALDRAPQRLDGHDLTDQLPRGERLEIHWP